ncbi:hypothetical protein IW261DRAFT_1416158 [Armillaria novae-zelandiae]|uniref:Uncharacterized protein n=1 Tax=Armillaria novae-zelandiae TaxID=153914 RepID=A0AA39UGH9_9AGAR|nr:hypothetical protein IW261DRAFT_1416158 [Armillaria novae-zelandiae]
MSEPSCDLFSSEGLTHEVADAPLAKQERHVIQRLVLAGSGEMADGPEVVNGGEEDSGEGLENMGEGSLMEKGGNNIMDIVGMMEAGRTAIVGVHRHHKRCCVVQSPEKLLILEDDEIRVSPFEHLKIGFHFVARDTRQRNARNLSPSHTSGKTYVATSSTYLNITFLSAAADLDMKRVQDLYDVNVFGAMRMVKAFVSLLIASSDACILQATLHAYGNTLRIELSPLNIKVVNLCSGSVKSDIIETKLNPPPSSSLYKSIESIVLESERRFLKVFVLPTFFSDSLTNLLRRCHALKVNPRAWLWEGSKRWFVWTVDFLPRTAFDNMMKGWYGIDQGPTTSILGSRLRFFIQVLPFVLHCDPIRTSFSRTV